MIDNNKYIKIKEELSKISVETFVKYYYDLKLLSNKELHDIFNENENWKKKCCDFQNIKRKKNI